MSRYNDCIVTGAWDGRWVVVSRYSPCIVTSGHPGCGRVTIRGQRDMAAGCVTIQHN